LRIDATIQDIAFVRGRHMKKKEIIDDIINGIDKLPTLPGIAIKILELVQKETSGLKEIADILATDPPLSGEVLRLINSSYYGLNSRITTVHHAVNLLGTATVKNLALSFSLVKNFKSTDEEIFDYSQFWKESLYSAVTSKLIATKLFPEKSEDAFFMGLLHNIGILTMVECMPDQYRLVLAEKEKNQDAYVDAENRVLGFTHMDVGYHLAHKWGLPEIFTIPIRFHHCPEKLVTQNPEVERATQILHLTSLVTDFLTLPDKTYLLGLLEFYIQNYGYAGTLEIEPIVEESQKLTETVFPMFDIKIESENKYLEMIETARKELISLSTDFLVRFFEQKRRIEVLNEKATHDGLTKLINYQRFQEVLDEEIYRSKRYEIPLTLVMVDLDYFKKINDTFGHLAGDYILRSVAEFLKQSTRKSDVIARYGGEEFAILLPETPIEGAYILADRIREKLAALRLQYGDQAIYVTASIGIASFSAESDLSNADLVKKADSALYRAKESGRNRCCLHGEAGKDAPSRTVAAHSA
jgi:diguanylate cyclase (GGDEF)-like protein